MNFIGVDIGKTVNMACRLAKLPELLEFKNNTKGIQLFLDWLNNFSNARILIEATGGYHYPLVWKLLKEDFDVRIINPLLAKRKRIVSLRKLKTDAHDATVLAELARDGKGTSWIPTPSNFQHRLLARTYHRCAQTLIQEQLRIKRIIELWNDTSATRPDWLNGDHLKQIHLFKKKLKKLLAEVNDPLIKRLSTIPGVSEAGASMIIAEVGSFERFGHIKQFIAYCGLDPSVHQSGGKSQVYGKLSKRGSPLLRTTFFQAAMGSWQGYFRSLYDFQREKQRSYTETLIIIARKIARIVYAIAKSPNNTFSMHYS